MTHRPKQIIAMGGGGFTTEPQNPLFDDFLLARTYTENPRVCLLPTAGGDSRLTIGEFFQAYGPRPCRPSVLSLFRREIDDIRAHLLAQDMIFVSGGNTANLMLLWRHHGLDAVLADAHERGILLAGVSAGGICWHESGITDSLGTQLASLSGCLGLVPGSFCPHYDSEAARRPSYHRALLEGTCPPGYAAEEHTALVYVDGTLERAVCSRPHSKAYRLECVEGEVRETPLETRYLGASRA